VFTGHRRLLVFTWADPGDSVTVQTAGSIFGHSAVARQRWVCGYTGLGMGTLLACMEARSRRMGSVSSLA
jgi:hypothetical protein